VPFKSKKQEQYLRLNEPEVYRDWKNKYGSYKGAESFNAEEWWEEYRDELESVDPRTLDMFEQREFKRFQEMKLPKAKAMQMLINSVEGDYSQLSPRLAKVAQKQEGAGAWSAESFNADAILNEEGYTASGHKVDWDDGGFYMEFENPIDGYESVDGVWYGGGDGSPDIFDIRVMDNHGGSFTIDIDEVEYYGDVTQYAGNRWRMDDAVIVSNELLEAIEEGLNWMIGDFEEQTVVERQYRTETFNAEKVKIDWDAVAKEEWDSGYPHNVSFLTYQNKQANKSLLSCLNAHLKIDKEDFDMGHRSYPDLKEHTIARAYEETYGRRPTNDEIKKALPKVIKGLRKQARTGKLGDNDWEELSKALKSPLSQYTWGIQDYTGRKGWFGLREDYEPLNAESFNADSEATATLKSALYSLTAVGVGVYIFKNFVMDRLPQRGEE
jgi:hypothetical protein